MRRKSACCPRCKGNSIEAAFEVESTTSVYSGLLRMSDLLARQPNISVPLFLVASDDRRDEVIRQVNRPTFATMHPPLVDVCRYISFEGLRDALAEANHVAVWACEAERLPGVCPLCKRRSFVIVSAVVVSVHGPVWQG